MRQTRISGVILDSMYLTLLRLLSYVINESSSGWRQFTTSGPFQWNILYDAVQQRQFHYKDTIFGCADNSVFRHAFLLIQYSFICKQYFFCSDREYQYFFWQIVNKTADCFNNIVLFWLWKLVEKIYWKNGKQLNVGKDLISV